MGCCLGAEMVKSLMTDESSAVVESEGDQSTLVLEPTLAFTVVLLLEVAGAVGSAAGLL